MRRLGAGWAPRSVGRFGEVIQLAALWTLRALGAGGLAVLCWWLSPRFFALFSMADAAEGLAFLPWGLLAAAIGAVVGALLAWYLTGKPWQTLAAMSGPALLAAAAGMLIGLTAGALVSIPLYRIGGWPGWLLPLLVSVGLGAAGGWLGAQRGRELRAVLPGLNAANDTAAGNAASGNPSAPNAAVDADGLLPDAGSRNGRILVDTSAIIDGRIADLTITGFLEGSLVVPRFVLDELRHIADSGDPLRRARGRRGLEVLRQLRRDATVPLQVLDVGVDGAEVDARLVELARSMKSAILTTDYNLNRVADIQGVQVLNVNELANALKASVLPGEDLRVNIVQEGKEAGQGVAYLDDGTMVVVEGGRRFIDTTQDVTVTRVLQTAAGRIIFAQPKAVRV